MTTNTATATPTTFRVLVAGHRQHDGVRAWGQTHVVVADTREAAAELALAEAVAGDQADMDRHNADADRFGTWRRTSLFDWKVEKVRKAPARRA